MKMRWLMTPMIAVGAVVLAGPASAHLLPVPPDLDVWLQSGSAVAVVRATEAPKPCTQQAWPAVQRVEVERILDGAAAIGPTELLLPDHHALQLAPGATSLAVLRTVRSGEGSVCGRVPDLAFAGPWSEPVDVEADLAGWTRYVEGVRGALPLGEMARDARLELWAEALASPSRVLHRHAQRRLTEAAASGTLRGAVIARLAALAADETAPKRARVSAASLVADRLPPEELGALTQSDLPEIATLAVRRILAAPQEPGWLARAVAPVRARFRPLGDGASPGALILHTGHAAVLAAAGDDRGRSVLERSLHHRLYLARELAILGLARLAERGDGTALEVLRARQAEEPDPRLRSLIAERLAGLETAKPPARASAAARAAAERETGLRMLLVLIGLLALLGMALVPLFVQRRRDRAAAVPTPSAR